MLRVFLLRTLNRYASKWLVLAIDLCLVSLSFFFAYAIRYNASLNFDVTQVLFQLPFVLIVALVAFLLVGSYKGIIRHTGAKDELNVFVATSIYLIGISTCLLYTSPSPRDRQKSRMPSSA